MIRYERGGEALWARSKQQCTAQDVGVCELCGSKRTFEIQIMAQMLYMVQCEGEETLGQADDGGRIEIVAERMRNDLDWATIVIFMREELRPSFGLIHV